MKTASTSRSRNTNFFRTFFLALVAALTLAASASALTITVDVGRKSRDCRGFGICGISVDLGSSMNAADARLNGNQLTISFAQPVQGAENLLVVEAPVELDSKTSQGLGASHVVIVPGTYQVDYSSNPNGEVTLPVQRIGITINIEAGRKSRDCYGFGICSITIDARLLLHPTPGVGTLEGDVLTVEFAAPTSEREDVLVIDEDIVLSPETSQALGSNGKRVVKSGSYPVDYSSNPNGTVHLSTERIGITIHVEAGRKSRDCYGFGICSITIDARMLQHPTPSIGTLEGDVLTVEFAAPTSEREDVLVIDEDIVLSPETSQALGSNGKRVVKRGSYPVDYSSNPNGTVHLTTERIGITIHVEAGRKSRDCNGFGICSITIDARMLQHPTPSIGTLEGDVLTVEFAAPTSEREDVLVIDEDIVLSPETSQALGSNGKRVVKRGSYPVDYSSNPNGTVHLTTERLGITIHVEAGRKSRDCNGFGICSITIDARMLLHPTPSIGTLEGDVLTVEFAAPTSEREDVLVIDEDILLSPETSQALGSNGKRVVKSGSYPVDYSSNPNGTVHLTTERIGITIHVEAGRKSRDCNGFGICSITIDARMLQHPTPSIGTLEGDVLTVEFAAPTSERGDVLVIDEDIVLSPETSQALGSDGPRVVKRGSYPVDYSTNPNGTVHLTTERIGITINIKIGRRSQGCRGFGICEIWIGADATLEAAQAAGRLNGNKLHIEFQSKLNEQGDALVIDEPVVLDEETSIALGGRKVVVLPGTYPVDYSSNPNGSVEVNVQRIGVTIGVDVGRRSKGCTGLGVCSITIDIDLRLGTNPTIASLEDSTLTLLFTSELPEQGETFTIEENMEVDSRVARMLGAKGLTIKKGEYQIRRDAKGRAYVALPVARFGITVTVYVGHGPSCTGFGICRIVIDRNFAHANAGDRAVQAIATTGNGTMEIDFLGETPDRENLMVLDRGITLDSATAAALGISEILPGEYGVDYSNNENGVVQLRTAGNSSTVAPEMTDATEKAQAFPNPTTGSTTLHFNVRRAGTVTVTLNDARGNQVAQILSRMMEAGRQNVNFDASRLADGVYFFTVRTGSGTESGRMVVTH